MSNTLDEIFKKHFKKGIPEPTVSGFNYIVHSSDITKAKQALNAHYLSIVLDITSEWEPGTDDQMRLLEYIEKAAKERFK